MNNYEQAKLDFKVHQLELTDQKRLLTLLQHTELAQKAGLQLMANQKFQQWAVQNWLQQDELYGIWVQAALIGLIAIFPFQDGGKIGYFIMESYQGKHIMTTALQQVISKTSYHRLYAEVESTNQASQQVLIHNYFQLISHDNDKLTYQWLR